MSGQARAILRAQYRSYINLWRKSGFASWATVISSLIWYGLFALFGWLLFEAMRGSAGTAFVRQYLGLVLLGILLYWQLVPVLLAATGFSLDTRKLLVYPIPHRQLFGIDVMLRTATSFEVFFLLAGIAAGAWANPQLPDWGPLALLPFAAFNLVVASGVKEWITRVLARRKMREIFAFLFVLGAALPQVLVLTGAGEKAVQAARKVNVLFLPWAAAAEFVAGRSVLVASAALAGAVALGYWFGRSQFERTLRFDADAARSEGRKPESRPAGFADRLLRWPSVLFRDPLGVLVEKEIRFLSRAPRFRLVFVMGFSFGLLIWVPMVLNKAPDSFMRQNYLSVVSAYALLLLAEVGFYNVFGFDRAAAQVYFAAPLRFQTVLMAKNIAALFFVLLEVAAIAAVCALFRLPLGALKLAEALAVTLVLSVFLMGAGNLLSVYHPRGLNPQKSMRSSGAGKSQLLLLLVFPAVMAPVALAFLARWALRSEAAFFGTLLVCGVIGACFYYVSMESAVGAAQRNREQFLEKLSQGEGPIL